MDRQPTLAIGLVETDLDSMEARLELLAADLEPFAEDTIGVDDELVVDSKVTAVVRVEGKVVFAGLCDGPPAVPANAEHHSGSQGLADMRGTFQTGLSDLGVDGLALPGGPEGEVLGM